MAVLLPAQARQGMQGEVASLLLPAALLAAHCWNPVLQPT
jgi:hypothetical protein